MSSQHLYIDDLSEQSVVNYLKTHADFFNFHEDLLTTMQIPHNRGAAISLVERQLTVLRDENQQLQRRLEQLISIAQKNQELNQRIQRLIIALLGAESADEFFDILYETLKVEFNTDNVVVRLFDSPGPSLVGRQEFIEYDAQVFTLFENLLGDNHPICGRLSESQIRFLFNEVKVGSAVLIPLGVPKPQGILALASQDVARFHAGMGTDLLKYMGDLISQLLRPWLRT